MDRTGGRLEIGPARCYGAAMRTLVRTGLVLLALVVCSPAAEKQWAGTYLGDWISTIGGVKGSFRMTLRQDAAGKWECDVMFTMGDREVKTTVKSLRVGDSKIEVSYEYDLSDIRLMSEITGELAENQLEGRYQAKTVPDGTPIDEGTWKSTRQSR